ncbi:serine hydrolase domain-containing protein [Sphingomonas changbaiensis]|uniref:serine hydrolase domain-containing protein n=1 Tax=Sphingomonas changbaiensis TaxID=529705 RepID=UPI00061CFC09|nr:serine hydrolase domain-containing protein [Sphingomonas changbaiensis]
MKKIRTGIRQRPRAAAIGGGLAGLVSVLALGPSLVAARAPAQVPQPAVYAGARSGVVSSSLHAPKKIDYERLDQRMRIAASKPDVVGMAVAVIENGEITFVQGYGTTTAGGSDPVTPNTVFRWASLSKGVAATMVGVLANEGKLSLDEPVAKFNTSLRLPAGGEQLATVADILSHRVGLPHNSNDNKLEAGADPKALRASLAEVNAICAPDTCHSYQNVAFDTTSEIVQRVTGVPYTEEVRRRLFAPLGMQNASLTRAGLMSARSWARPHIGRRTVEVNDNYYRIPAAGGVNSSIMDMALWMRAQMGLAPQVVPERVLDTIHEARVNTERRNTMFARVMGPSRYALGWRDYTYAGHALIGHQGAVMGYRSTILFDPQTKSGVAVLWNSQSTRPSGVQLEVLEMLYDQPRNDWLKIDSPGGGPIQAEDIAAQ